MYELTQPFVRLWDWVGREGGFAGQVFFCALVVMSIVGALTWFSNRR